jgi:hypothetical protein
MAIYTSGFICVHVLEEKDKVVSAIRIIDNVTADLPQNVSPGTLVFMPPFTCDGLILFKSDGPEEFDAVFTAIAPDGTRMPSNSQHVSIAGGPSGHTMILRLNFNPQLLGLWWLEVLVRGNVALKMPLRINPSQGSTNQSQT